MIYTKELFSFISGLDDNEESQEKDDDEEIIIKRKGKKIVLCAYARYLMFGVK